MDKLFLRLAKSFDPLLQKAGVNTNQLHTILRVKLLMDNRRPRTLFAKKRSNTSSVTNPWMVTFFTLLMGVLISMVLFFTDVPLAGHTFYFTIFMILMCFTLVSDFTTVLIDTRDQFILLPRPVDDRTIAVSRILHISIYVLRLALLQGLPGIIMVCFIDKNVASPFIMLVEILEATFLSILFVNLIYLAMMRSVNPQRFKDLISYFQIAFSTMIFAAYYLLPRLVDFTALRNINLLHHWWAYILPPVWISALNTAVVHPSQVTIAIGLLAVTGLATPVIGLWLVVKVFAPGFNKRLAVLATSDGDVTSASSGVKKVYKQDFRDKVANFVAPDPLENAGFRITWKLAARTREFKMKAYPAFGFVPIMFLYFALSGKGMTIGEKMSRIQGGAYYVLLIYLSTIVLSSILANITHSEKYKSAWVYYALPIGQPAKILSGMYKAIITLYFLPFVLILGTGMVFVWGPKVINDVILAFIISTIYGILIALFTVKGLPFSKPILAKQGGGRAVSNLITMALVGVLGYGHYFIVKWEMVVWIAIIPVAGILWIMLHYYKKTTWTDLESFEENEIEKPEKPKRIKKPIFQTK
jgi:ABC-2 type transport system permease protein